MGSIPVPLFNPSSENMKILVCVSEYYPFGTGIANVAYNIVEDLKRMGHQCVVCSPTGPDIKLGSAPLIDRWAIGGLLQYWDLVATCLNGDDYDVVWLHNPMFIRANPFKRSIATVHSTYYDKYQQRIAPVPYYAVTAALEKYCLKKTAERAVFTGVSPMLCSDLETIGINRENIIFIPNGVNTVAFVPPRNDEEKQILRKKYAIPPGHQVLLSLGRVSDAKRPQTMLEVFDQVRAAVPDLTLIVAGGGEMLEETKALAAEKHLDTVIFLGPVDYDTVVPELYKCADYYLMTSKSEGSPLTLLEAMSSGLPSIVSNLPPLLFIGEEDCGIVVDFGDEKKAAAAIIGYLRQDNSVQAAKARTYAADHLDWHVITAQYLEQFERLA